MSGLSGFKAQNHPQQIAKRGVSGHIDERETTPEFFAELDDEFHFTLDVAATAQNTKCKKFFTPELNGLEQMWSGSVWCNPPYSDLKSWVAKAWDEWSYDDDGLQSIVMLVPANRTEQGWWQDYVEPRRDRQGAYRPFTTRFIRGRLRFIHTGEDSVRMNDRPPFGCVLLIWNQPSPSSSAPTPEMEK
jgi:phage N-6-adenine-methyltransferase